MGNVMKIRNQKDFLSGLLFIALSVIFIVMSTKYDFGNLKEIGPGFFPLILGCILMVLGIAVTLISLGAKGEAVRLSRWHWKPIIVLSASILAFAITIPTLGFAAAIVILLVISSFAYTGKRKTSEFFLMTIGLTLLAVLVFIVGLKLPIDLLPAFLVKGGM